MTKSLVQELLEARYGEFTPAVLQVIDAACAEGLKPTDAEVGERVLAAMEALNQASFRGSQPPTREEMTRRIEYALDYEDQLLSMNDGQRQELYHENQRRHRDFRNRKARIRDVRDFGHPKHDPDFEFWNKQLVWSVKEALYLSLNKNPKTANFESVSTLPSLLRDEYDLRKNALTSVDELNLESVRPVNFFAEWFRERKVSTPAEFGAANTLCGPDAELVIQKLQAENRSLRAELEKAKPKIDRTTSMRAMIYCVAVEKYRYDPKKKQNASVTQIENCMIKVALDKGNERLKASNKTVHDVLREAAEHFAEVDPEIGEKPAATPLPQS